MNKIVQNHIEKLFLTSDAATMIKELDIRHPAAKMVVMAAHQQEEETGNYHFQFFFRFQVNVYPTGPRIKMQGFPL